MTVNGSGSYAAYWNNWMMIRKRQRRYWERHLRSPEHGRAVDGKKEASV